jgi:glycosyltransferase involved in cell wall biosynthesis
MRVLVVTNMYPTPVAPAFGTFVYDQVRSLRRLGVEVDVFFVNGRVSTANYFWAFPRFWLFLRGRRYDVVHAHYVLAGIIARAQLTCPTVLTHHGPEVLGQPRWQGPLCRLVTPLFDEVIYVSEETRRKLNDNDGWVIPCGVDLDLFRPAPRDEARARLKLPATRPLVLWAGEYWRPEKRFDLVKAAMARVKELMPDAELILLTKQPHDVVPDYMNACDVLILTSDLEGSPMVIKEAMACNLPIVSVRVGDVPEVVGGTPGCFLVERDPTAIAGRTTEVLRSPYRTDGRSRVAHLSQDEVAHRVLEVYERAVSRRNRRIASYVPDPRS